MKKICLYFQVHQPFRLRSYSFLDIGASNNYFDDKKNVSIMRNVAEKCYLPANDILLNLIKEYGNQFKISFSISGTAMEQLEQYAPEVVAGFKKLAASGSVEFLAETYSHSLSSVRSEQEFRRQVRLQIRKVRELFNQHPVVFCNTELIYSNHIGKMVSMMGFRGMVTEGADHILGWRSPNYLYYHPDESQFRLLLNNYKLSYDIALRFSQQSRNEWPLTAEKFARRIDQLPNEEEIVNLFLDYEAFGEHQLGNAGILYFLKTLPKQILASGHEFITPSEAFDKLEPVGKLNVTQPVSGAGESKDLSAWLGNVLQDDAFDSLYKIEDKMQICKDEKLQRDWLYLQSSDHFYYMSTKRFADGDLQKYFNHYDSPYEAFVNFMYVLKDFEIRLNNYIEATGINDDHLSHIAIEKRQLKIISNSRSFIQMKEFMNN
jgi:alpha-amylase